jgi:multiple RNA-binding domain-containing protein 1
LSQNSWGASRKFGFIGYKTEAAAETAMQYFNNTYINTSRITVEKAIAYGSDNLPRAWSKYSEGSSAHDRLTGGNKTKKAEFAVEETDAFHDKQRKDREEFINSLNAEKSDPKLKEYLDVMTTRSKSKTWANDDSANAEQQEKKNEETKVDYVGSDDELYDDLPPKKSNDTTKDDEEEDEDVEMKDEEEDKSESKSKSKSSTRETATSAAVEEEEEKKEEEVTHIKSENPKELIEDTGRLFIRNLSYACTEQDLRELFEKYGTLSEVHMPIARDTKKSKGYAYILYMMPEHALKAYEALDMQTFQGRLLHIIPAQEKPPAKEEDILGVNGIKLSAVKKDKEKKRRNLAGNDFNWNSLYMSVSRIPGLYIGVNGGRKIY